MTHEKKSKALLRITTAGSVDDGKSTLIGRLLFESAAVYDDQLAALRRGKTGTAPADQALDLSLLTDGLKSEREQGITIDVAYKYFSSEARKFILADAPGHVQYTRNMVTAASRADVAIILVDASQGVLEQTRRHAYLIHLLGVPQVILAINKIDKIGYDPVRVAAIEADFRALSWYRAGGPSLAVVPLSALEGVNIVERSTKTPWYRGPALLELLNALEPRRALAASFALPLQYVGRGRGAKRFAAGTLGRGRLELGAAIKILPSQRQSRVAKLWVQGELAAGAEPGQAVAFELEDEIDLERGQLLVAAHTVVPATLHFSAELVWFDSEGWRPQERYILRIGTQSSRAHISRIVYRFDLERLEPTPAGGLQLNDIARVELQSSRPLFAEAYASDRDGGAFVLIDPETYRTVAAGMLVERLDAGQKLEAPALGRLSLSESLAAAPGDGQNQLLQIPRSFTQLNSETAQLHALGLLLELGWSIRLEKSPEAERLSRGLAHLGFASFEAGSGI